MEIIASISAALGVNQQVQDLGTLQMVLRACVVYVFTLLVIKAAKRRFMGKSSAFDVVMVIILGSVISRAISQSMNSDDLSQAKAIVLEPNGKLSVVKK